MQFLVQFVEIELSDVYESETNPRGNFNNKSLEELVSSIKEKGVLVPIIVREKDGEKYEIIAGCRRFRASKLAGLKTIPAEIKNLSDEEAREVQIIENLQREDIHPIDEGISYRKLVEESHYDIITIALRVAKSETYVRQRLLLTNLSEKAAAAYRAGKVKSASDWGQSYIKVNDSHMMIIAKLSHADQDRVLEEYIAERSESVSVSNLKDWIEENIYDILSNQPWLTEKGAMAEVGPCQECQPDHLSLFGEIKEGACTDTRCWKRKMGKYIFWKMEKEGIKLKVSEKYSPEDKILLGYSKYEKISSKKDQCDFMEKAMIAEGSKMGKVVNICKSASCEKHGSCHSDYALTPEEKKKRQEENKKEKEKEQRKLEKKNNETEQFLQFIKWPIDEKVLDLLFELTMSHSGSELYRPIIKRRGIEILRSESHGGIDHDKSLREAVKNMGPEEKLRMIVEILLPVWDERRIEIKNLFLKNR